MSESLDTKIQNLVNDLSKKEKEKSDLEREIFQLTGTQSIELARVRIQGYDTNSSLHVKIKVYDDLNFQIDRMRQQWIAYELSEMRDLSKSALESSRSLEALTKKLTDSAESTLAVSRSLTSSSKRLESLSTYLILFTVILSLLTALNVAVTLVINESLPPSELHGYLTDLGYVTIVILALFVGFVIFSGVQTFRMNRQNK
jgi:Mg2+ and Co2+ transporter CorA